jgi:hypothetical protein
MYLGSWQICLTLLWITNSWGLIININSSKALFHKLTLQLPVLDIRGTQNSHVPMLFNTAQQAHFKAQLLDIALSDR